METYLKAVVDAALAAGATEASARFVVRRAERVRARNDQVDVAARDESGLCVVARKGAAAGCAAVAMPVGTRAADLGRAAALEAVAAADAVAVLLPRNAPTPPPVTPGAAYYRNAAGRDPFSVPIAHRAALARAVAKAARGEKAVSLGACTFRFVHEATWITTRAGEGVAHHHERVLVHCGAGVRVLAADAGEQAVRTFPAVGGGVWSGGYEAIEREDWPARAALLARECAAQVRAPLCAPRECDVVLDEALVARLLHETLGHALGARASAFGATPEGSGKARVASAAITLSHDPTLEGGVGSMAVDDEGAAPQPRTLVHAGFVRAVVADRAQAARLGVPRTGLARAASFREPPRLAIANLALSPGAGDAAALVAPIADGLFLAGARGFAVDPNGGSFRIVAESARQIKGGKLGGFVRGAGLAGTLAEVWGRCDAVAGLESSSHVGLWCREEHERTPIAVGHRVMPVRMRAVRVEPVAVV